MCPTLPSEDRFAPAGYVWLETAEKLIRTSSEWGLRPNPGGGLSVALGREFVCSQPGETADDLVEYLLGIDDFSACVFLTVQRTPSPSFS